MLIDYEAVVADLEAYVEGKDGRSFGQREITDVLLGLRVRHRVVEGLPERALRLYGTQLIEVLRQHPATPDPEGPGGMGDGAPHRVGPTGHEEELHHVGSNGHG